MALATTTLSSAVAIDDNSIVVASATSVSAGRLIRIDDEILKVGQAYSSGTTVPVLRGQDGSAVVAHNSGANVTHGLASDFSNDPNGAYGAQLVPSQRASRQISLTAAATLSLPSAGENLFVVLNGTTIIALTIPVPTKDLDTCELNIISNGAAAHTLTFTGGLSGASTSYDVITINASAPAAFKFVACNGLWMAYCQPPMGGTVTNLIGSIA